jgi:hypothetical protein
MVAGTRPAGSALTGPRSGMWQSYPENFSEGGVDHDREARFDAHATWVAALESRLSNQNYCPLWVERKLGTEPAVEPVERHEGTASGRFLRLLYF